MKTIFYISASSGGGHDGVARALEALGRKCYGGQVQQEIVNFYGGGALRMLPVLSRLRYHSQWLWRVFLALTDSRPMSRAIAWVLRPLALRWLKHKLPKEPPDMLVAVHFGAAQVLEALARSYPTPVKTAIVVTDYQAHWGWFARAERIVVPDAFSRARALAAGYGEGEIIDVDLLPCRVSEAPAAEVEKPRPRALQVLAAAGADGTSAERLKRILGYLDRSPEALHIRVEVVCGRGERLKNEVDALRDHLHALEVTTVGYVDDMPERLKAADVALLRASPQTLTETLAAGTPAVAFDWHAHEIGNGLLLTRWGCGVATREPREAAEAIERFAAERAALEDLRKNARAVAARAPALDFAEKLFRQLH